MNLASHHKSFLFFGAILTLLVLLIGIGFNPVENPTASSTPTEANLKVAFIGDSGYGANFDSVLNLIKNEGAQIVLHQGDFDYNTDPTGFEAKINSVLGSSFPYFVSVGNHDVENGAWSEGCTDPQGCYATLFKNRMSSLGITLDDSNLNDEMYAITYRGLKMVFVGQNGNNSAFASFINTQLSSDDHIWKICSWHKNQQAMQVGGKTDEMGWDVYENCRVQGAVIATAHEHSYSRTKTLTNMTSQTVDSTCSDPNSLCVDPGRTFALVSGLGGQSIRSQTRCLPTSYPYGCNGEWASIYTSSHGATYGAFFITFYVDGDSRKARGYFKNISGSIVDGPFEIRVSAPPPLPPPPPPPPPPVLQPPPPPPAEPPPAQPEPEPAPSPPPPPSPSPSTMPEVPSLVIYSFVGLIFGMMSGGIAYFILRMKHGI